MEEDSIRMPKFEPRRERIDIILDQAKGDKVQQHVIKALDVIEQKMDWIAQREEIQGRDIRQCQSSLFKVKETVTELIAWKQNFTGKLSVTVGVVAIGMTILTQFTMIMLKKAFE